MDFKISIKCEKCKCTFELRPEGFSDRENMQCPNCGQELEKVAFSHLKAGLLELSEVPDLIPKDSTPSSVGGGKRPKFSLKVKEYNMVMDHFGHYNG